MRTKCFWGWLIASGSGLFSSRRSIRTTNPRCADGNRHHLPAEPTVTFMKVDSHLQVDPSTMCVIDAKSASDHLVRESTGGQCRRTAQELCVIRRSMQTLRARCRWLPHERMVVDALTKRHNNSVTMLRLLRDGVLSIVDEDQ